MKLRGVIVIICLLLFIGLAVAQEYIEVQDSVTGITSKALKSAQDWFIRGNQLYNNGSYELAILCYDRAIELDPSYASPWVNKGFCLKQLGRYEGALEAFDNATILNPLVPDLWKQKGDILEGLGRYSEANDAYSKAKELGYTGRSLLL